MSDAFRQTTAGLRSCQEPRKNALSTGDNLLVLHGMNSEAVNLIYLSLPFNPKRTYTISAATTR